MRSGEQVTMRGFFTGRVRGALAWLVLALVPVPAVAAVLMSATQDLTCAGDRFGSTLNCTANEFTVNPVFSAEPGSPPFCMAGTEFRFVVDLELSGSNTTRYDGAFFVGQTGNDPSATGNLGQCSVSLLPFTPAPWADVDGDTCGDLYSTSNTTTTVRIDEIKVVCQADAATSSLAIPYVLGYAQNPGDQVCGVDPILTVKPGSKSKCDDGTATVSGVIPVYAGTWVDVTKQTNPDGHAQPFTFTATYTGADPGVKVVALKGATLTTTGYTGGTWYMNNDDDIVYPQTITSATNTVTFTLADGQTARVFMSGATSSRNLRIVEGAVTGWDPTAAISCDTTTSGWSSPTPTLTPASRQIDVLLNTTNKAVACTYTNTKLPTLTLTKVSNGDVGTFNFTGNNGWDSQNITTVTSGVGVAGATQVLDSIQTNTTVTEAAVAGYRLADISCSGLGSGAATPNLAARSVTFDISATDAGREIACTFTNQRQRTLTVNKVLTPGGDAGLFVMNANGTTGTEAGNGATASATVDVGVAVTASEAAGTGTALANYDADYTCNTTPATLGSGNSVTFTMPNADTTCTFTNARYAAQLTLAKAWQNAISGNAATVTSTGFGNNATSGLSTSTGNNTTTGSAVTVYAGETGTIGESFSSGSAVNYNALVGCTGTTGLSGDTLTVQPADTSILCTLTNQRKSATLTLRKSWVNGFAGDTVTGTSTGFTNNATTGAAVSTGTNTVTGTAVTVYAAESGALAETWSVGDPAEYVEGLACTGTSGLSGGTLTVDPADTAIVCTFTNSKKQPSLSLLKWSTLVTDPLNCTTAGDAGSCTGAPKAIPGSVRHYTIRVTNSGPGQVDNNSFTLSDPLPPSVALYVGDFAGPGLGPVIFADGTPASGLAWTWTALASLADSVEFSADNGATWTYVPVPDADGYDAAVNRIRFKPSGAMSAAGAGNPYADFSFRVRVK